MSNPTEVAAVSLRLPRWSWWLAACYVLVGMCWLWSEGSFHGDESFYTDAVLHMLRSGDWWRPEYADGSARLNKPLLVYWLMAVSMSSLGASLFAARLPLLLAGGLLLLCSTRLAMALLPRQRELHALAACMVVGNVSLLGLAVRSTPDMLLVLAVTIGFVGLADLLVLRRAARQAAPWLWAGIGLAAAAKGGLAVLLLLFAAGAIALLRREAGVWRGLLHLPTMLVSGGVAVAALAPLWLLDRHGTAESFLADQVTTRLAPSLLDAFLLALEYLGSLLRHFLPWALAPLVLYCWRRPLLRQLWQQHRMATCLVLAFVGLQLLVFASANVHRGRYLSPTYPALAVVLAPFVAAAVELPGYRASLRWLLGLAAVLVGLLGLFLLRVDPIAAVGSFLVALAALPILRRSALATAGGLLLWFAALNLVVVPGLRDTFRPSCWEAALLADRLDATWGFDPSTGSIVRIMSHGRLDPVVWELEPPTPQLTAAQSVLARGQAAARLASLGYELQPCGTFTRQLQLQKLSKVVFAANPETAYEASNEPVFLALRR